MPKKDFNIDDQSVSTRDFVALEIHQPPGMQIRTAPIEREWMDATNDRFAYRCLPLVIANQAGWMVHCPMTFLASWYGGKKTSDLLVDFIGKPTDLRVRSHFGDGILTFSLPFLFRTPPGINLWVKGPSNHIKDGIQPLEGVVETDWSPATFTMNWKMTRPGATIRFEKDEPICMLVPVTRGLAESLIPRRAALSDNCHEEAAYDAWRNSRAHFNASLRAKDEEAVKQAWQKDYFRGTSDNIEQPREHQTRLHLKEFD